MKITRLRICNFRSIDSLDLELGDTTVFIGPNNSGKTAILDAVRIVLTRRWGQRGTGFTENDVHRINDEGDPRTLPPVTIDIVLEEPESGAWDPDMVAALEDVMTILPRGTNGVTVRVTCAWNPDREAFDPRWEFLDTAGQPMTGKAQRATNLTGFFAYLPLFWLNALRDAPDEFTSRSVHWGRLLRSVRIPKELENDAVRTLAELDSRLIAADPRLAEIAGGIGQATQVAIGEGPGAAKLNMLPLGIEDMLQRAGVMLRNENLRPWLPLASHGQGLQSLAVIFLLQASVLQQLAEAERPGIEAVFAIEEPEAHLHPQAARTLWPHILGLKGQKLIATHSPYFTQHVPLRDLRLVCLRAGRTEVAAIPRRIVSDLPWTDPVATLAEHGGQMFGKDSITGHVAATSWFDDSVADRLKACYRTDQNLAARSSTVDALRHSCRIMVSPDDERQLGFHGRRVRGEIFFARRWILVEGVSDYLLLHALGQALDWPLDVHGVAVIDFQQAGSPGIYAALAEAFAIPWNILADGDAESTKFLGQLTDRGFRETDLRTSGQFVTLPPPNNLEDQLLADGHEALLREVLEEAGYGHAHNCPEAELRGLLKNKKTDYMGKLAPRVASDPTLAARMPTPFLDLLTRLRGGTA
jgi:putative ATP-dependent endonuclease of the OLD family